MKRLFVLCVVLGLAGSLARAATPLLISSDGPTTETATLTTLREFQVYRYNVPVAYTLTLTIPGNPELTATTRWTASGAGPSRSRPPTTPPERPGAPMRTPVT